MITERPEAAKKCVSRSILRSGDEWIRMGHGCGHEKTIVCMWIISNPFFSTPNDVNTSQCMSSLPGEENEWMNEWIERDFYRRVSTFMGFSNSLKTEHTSTGELRNANACWQPNLNKFYTRFASFDFCMNVNRSFFHPRNFRFALFFCVHPN